MALGFPIMSVTQSFTGTGVGTGTMASGIQLEVGRAATMFLDGGGGGTLKFQNSFDNGTTWYDLQEPLGSAQSVVLGSGVLICVPIPANEITQGVLWRMNCTAYTAGTLVARLTQ